MFTDIGYVAEIRPREMGEGTTPAFEIALRTRQRVGTRDVAHTVLEKYRRFAKLDGEVRLSSQRSFRSEGSGHTCYDLLDADGNALVRVGRTGNEFPTYLVAQGKLESPAFEDFHTYLRR